MQKPFMRENKNKKKVKYCVGTHTYLAYLASCAYPIELDLPRTTLAAIFQVAEGTGTYLIIISQTQTVQQGK